MDGDGHLWQESDWNNLLAPFFEYIDVHIATIESIGHVLIESRLKSLLESCSSETLITNLVEGGMLFNAFFALRYRQICSETAFSGSYKSLRRDELIAFRIYDPKKQHDAESIQYQRFRSFIRKLADRTKQGKWEFSLGSDIQKRECLDFLTPEVIGEHQVS
eukprot:CRZ01531.1 hypothetical protein [Spongospora subterranea]